MRSRWRGVLLRWPVRYEGARSTALRHDRLRAARRCLSERDREQRWNGRLHDTVDVAGRVLPPPRARRWFRPRRWQRRSVASIRGGEREGPTRRGGGVGRRSERDTGFALSWTSPRSRTSAASPSEVDEYGKDRSPCRSEEGDDRQVIALEHGERDTGFEPATSSLGRRMGSRCPPPLIVAHRSGTAPAWQPTRYGGALERSRRFAGVVPELVRRRAYPSRTQSLSITSRGT